GITIFNYPFLTAYIEPGFTTADAPSNAILGRSNYVGMGGYPYADAGDGTAGTFTGILTWNTTVTVDAVTNGDGASNTILYGEYVGGGFGGQPTSFSNLGSGILGPSWVCGSGFTYWGPDTGVLTDYYRFGSAHPNVFNICLADGS